MLSIPEPVSRANRLSTTLAWLDGERTFALEGNITHTGSGAAWLGRMIGVTNPVDLTALAESVPDNQGVYYVPARQASARPGGIYRPAARFAD